MSGQSVRTPVRTVRWDTGRTPSLYRVSAVRRPFSAERGVMVAPPSAFGPAAVAVRVLAALIAQSVGTTGVHGG